MLDSVQVLEPGARVLDDNGNPISGAKLKFYLAGTSTPYEVFADAALTVSLGSTVTCDGAGYPTTDGSTKTLIYVGTSSYKIVITESDGTPIVPSHDNIPGAISSSSLGGSGSGAWETSVTTLATDTTLDSTYYGKLIQANPTGGSFTLTLPSAVTATNKKRIGFRHSGTANQVKIATVSGQTIYLPGGQSTVGFSLADPGQVAWLVSDGANWTADFATRPFGRGGVIPVVSRLTAEPSGPKPGAIYMVSGTPTGTWSSAGYAANDLLEADGQGGWIRRTPTADCGWIAYVQNEDLNYQYQSSSWVALSNITAPAQVYQGKMVLEYSQANGTDGGATITGARTTYPTGTTNASATMTYINSSDANAINGATLTTNKIKLPVGWYHLQGGAVFDSTDSVHLIFRNSTTSTDVFAGPVFVWNSGSNLRGITPLEGTFQVTSATDEYIIQYWAASGSAVTAAMGRASAFSDGAEVYGRFVITSLAMQQGPIGATGPQGNTGPGYLATSTSSVAIGTGSKTFTTQSGLAYLAGMRVRVAKDSSNYIEGPVSSYSGTSLVISADRSVGSGTYTAWNIGLAGDVGATGAAGTNGTNGTNGATGATGASGPVAIDYTWDTATTAADPGSGKVRASVATFSGSFNLYISETDRLSNNIATFIQSMDDSTNTTTKGVLEIIDLTTPANRVFLSINGTITDNGTYDTIPVAYKSGVTSFSAVNVGLLFTPAGDKGVDGAGSFTSLSPGAGTTSDTTAAAPGSAITTSGTISAAELVNAQVGTTYTFVNGDRAKLVTFSNASSIAATLPQAATTTAFTTGWFVDVVNLGAGTLTITPTTSTINGASSLVIPTNRGCRIVSDGTNYQISMKPLVAGTDYLAPPSGTALLKANSGGALANATAGTDYLAPPSGTAILKANSGGALANAAAGTDYVAPGGALGTPSSGVLTNCTGLPASSLVASTTQAVGFGSIELGHASDTTIARVAAGTVTIEGNTILTNNQTATIAKGFTLQPNNLGTVTSGTVTLDPTAHNYQYLINGGAFTLAPPAAGFQAALDVRVINGPSAGSITLSTGKWRPMTGTASFSTTSRASATITVTIASPGVVSWTGHGCIDGDPIYFTTTGALPTGLSVNTVYYVKYVDANSFQLSATPGGTAINTSGSQSGTHTGVACSVFDLIVREPFGTPAYAWVALQ